MCSRPRSSRLRHIRGQDAAGPCSLEVVVTISEQMSLNKDRLCGIGATVVDVTLAPILRSVR